VALMRSLWFVLAALLVVPALVPADAKEEKATTYKDVKGIIETNCVSCHSGGKAKAGLDVTTLENINKGSRKTKTLIVAGKPDESKLFTVCTKEGRPVMPPPKSKRRPSADDVALLKKWIEDGAKE